MMLLALFATIALVLAMVGIYGVISYAVSQRTAEVGIRIAIGAEPADVTRMILAEGARLTFTGVGVGLVGAWILSRFMVSQLYGISATDPMTFVLVAVGGSVGNYSTGYLSKKKRLGADGWDWESEKK